MACQVCLNSEEETATCSICRKALNLIIRFLGKDFRTAYVPASATEDEADDIIDSFIGSETVE